HQGAAPGYRLNRTRMPTYQYRCRECRFELEELQSITEPPLTTCPACGRAGLDRIIGAGAGLIFRGSGFYLTDYRKEPKPPPPVPKKGEAARGTAPPPPSTPPETKD
ncbi:MAG: FmdB family zinc ribbon protein, partial [Bacteroidota bacterium]